MEFEEIEDIPIIRGRGRPRREMQREKVYKFESGRNTDPNRWVHCPLCNVEHPFKNTTQHRRTKMHRIYETMNDIGRTVPIELVELFKKY